MAGRYAAQAPPESMGLTARLERLEFMDASRLEIWGRWGSGEMRPEGRLMARRYAPGEGWKGKGG